GEAGRPAGVDGFQGDEPLGGHELDQPAAQLAALAAVRVGQGRAGRSGPDRVLSIVHFGQLEWRAGDPGDRRHGATSRATAGEYSTVPAPATLISAHHFPGAVHGGGAMSKPTSTSPRAGTSAPTARGPANSQVPQGLTSAASTASGASAELATVTEIRPC